MATPSVHFRPRPIDINSQLPVIHDELDESEAIIATSLPSLVTGMDKEEENVSLCLTRRNITSEQPCKLQSARLK